MRGRIAFAGALAALAAAPPALAANADVQAVDGPTGINDNSWSPAAVSVNAGDTVTWHFNTNASHNVRSTTPNWTIDTPFRRSGDPPATYTFTAEGTYDFVCELHPEMTGRVTVGTPPPPPPPPLSQQPFANDQPAPAFDTERPALHAVRATARGRSARVRFRLTERSAVTLKAVRGKRTSARRVVTRRAGTHVVTLRGLRPGRYRIELRATDLSGNRSPLRRARVLLR